MKIFDRPKGVRPKRRQCWASVALANVKLQSAFGPDETLFIVRRAHEVATLRAAHAFDIGATCEDFNRVQDLAKAAQKALDKLLKNLGSEAMVGVERGTAAIMLATPILILDQGRRGGEAGNMALAQRAAVDDATALLRARDVAMEINDAAIKREKKLRQGRQKAGDLAQLEFAKVMAAAWEYIFKKRPPLGTASDTNPFLQFIQAGWGAAERPPAAFVGAMRALSADRKLAKQPNSSAVGQKSPEWL